MLYRFVKKEIAMKAASLTLVIVLSFSMVSCLKNSVVVPTGQQSRSSVSIGLSLKDAPEDVASIVGILSRQGYDTLTKSFTVIPGDSAECEFDNVAVGTWHLQVNAYNETDTLKYSGSTDVNVVAGQTTPVSLVLSATGSISVIVTWNNQDTSGTDMALKFGGVNGKIDFSASSVLHLQTMTVELRVLFDTLVEDEPILVWQVPDVYYYADGFEIPFEKGLLYFELTQNSSYGIGPSCSFTPTSHKWVNIACTYDGSSIKIYIDGSLAVQEAYNTPVYYDNNLGFCLGYAYNSYFGGPHYFKGAMDELRIWNYARTQEMIDSSMNSKLTGSEPGLVGYWDFNQNSSDTYAIDRTGNGNDGVLVGGIQFVPVSSLDVTTGIDKLHR